MGTFLGISSLERLNNVPINKGSNRAYTWPRARGRGGERGR